MAEWWPDDKIDGASKNTTAMMEGGEVWQGIRGGTKEEEGEEMRTSMMRRRRQEEEGEEDDEDVNGEEEKNPSPPIFPNNA